MDRRNLIKSLKGQTMHVPDFEHIFEGWPAAFNPNLERLRQNVNERMEKIVEKQYKHKSERTLALKKLHAPNYALLGAYWWPFVDERMLQTMTYMAIWIALWDDVFEREAPTFEAGVLADDWEDSQKYRYQTLLYIRQALRLPCGSYQRRPDNVYITSFEDIASHVNAVCSIDQKKRLYHQLEQHIIATGDRQHLRLSPEVPTMTEYLDARMGTSGVRVCGTLLEICQETHISSQVRADPQAQKLLDQITIIILVTNDMCSLKSKVSRGSVDNLLALLCLSHADLESAVSVATTVLEAAKNDFDDTARELVERHAADHVALADLEELIGASRAVCTGNLVWSMSTRRYDLHLDDDFSRTIIL